MMEKKFVTAVASISCEWGAVHLIQAHLKVSTDAHKKITFQTKQEGLNNICIVTRSNEIYIYKAATCESIW